MSAMSDYLEEQVLHWLLDGTVYIGLALASVFTDSSYASEVTGSGYARQALVGGFTIADAGGGQWQAVNTSEFSFPTATDDYGSPPTDEVEGFGIFDALSGDNLLVHAAFASSFPVFNGNTVYIAAGGLIIEAQ